MARRMKHDEQVDPFTAGEPTLPWEDPEPLHEDEVCTLTGGDYDGPTKRRDNYDAPSNDERSVADIIEDLFPANGGEDGSKPSKAAKRTVGKRMQAKRRDAGRDTGGTHSGKTFKVIKWIVIGVVTINLIPLVMGLFAVIADDLIPGLSDEGGSTTDFPLAGHESPDLPDVDPDSLPDFSEDELEEQAIADFTTARLDAEKANGSDTHGLIAQALDADLSEELGYSAQELGIDTAAYADWLLSKFSYAIDSAYAFDDGTGSLYFNGVAPSHYAIVWDATDSLYTYLSDENLLEAQETHHLTAEQQQTARELFDGALERATASESFASLDFYKEGGAWTMDEEEFNEEMAFVLGLV